MKKSQEEIAADKLLKRFEEADKFKKISGKAAGFAAFLAGKTEEEILYEDLKYKELPILLLKLQELYLFYERKQQYNDNVRNLKNEIEYCLNSLDIINKQSSLNLLRETKKEVEFIKNKYGVE